MKEHWNDPTLGISRTRSGRDKALLSFQQREQGSIASFLFVGEGFCGFRGSEFVTVLVLEGIFGDMAPLLYYLDDLAKLLISMSSF